MGIVRERRKQDIDTPLAAIVALLLLIGTIVIYSASAMWAETRFSGDAFFFKRQLLWLILSVAVIFLMSKVDYHKYQQLAWLLLLLSILLLVAVLFTRPVNGARRWISLGLIGIQPSEIFKYTLIIFLAAMLAVKRMKIKMLRSVLLPAFPAVGIGFTLILLEPNLGAVLVLSAVVLVLFFVAGVRKRLLFLFTGTIGLAAYLMVFVGGYKKDRIYDWFQALLDPLQAGYQVKQSILAIGSGGLIGPGLGRGSAKLLFLPAPHTDFVFATLAEEGGFIAAILLLAMLLVVIWRGMRIATYSPDLLGFYLALGITMLICVQAALNLMVATALVPVTGLPLPFISYGGSSLLLTSIGVGILLNISRQNVKTPQLFKMREGGR